MNSLHRQSMFAPLASLQRFFGWLASPVCRIALCIVTALLGVLYIAQVSAMTATGYDLAALEERREVLRRDHERLGLQIAEHQSMTAIEKRITDLQFVAVDTVQYLTHQDTVVARR